MNKNESEWKKSTPNRLKSLNSRERKDITQSYHYNNYSITPIQLSTIKLLTAFLIYYK